MPLRHQYSPPYTPPTLHLFPFGKSTIFFSKRFQEEVYTRPCIREHIVAMVGPAASFNPLSRTDGSASYQCPSTGFNILSSVNAPIELPGRRDALKPEEATVEVFVKPGTGQGGVGEQYAKEIIKNMLAKLVLGREKGLPRRGIVVTLAVIGGESVGRGDPVSGDECMKVCVVV